MHLLESKSVRSEILKFILVTEILAIILKYSSFSAHAREKILSKSTHFKRPSKS